MTARCRTPTWLSGLGPGGPWVGVVTGAALLSGCAGPVAVRARHPAYPGQGASPSAMVMMKPHPAPPGGFDEAGAADAVRRDGELSVRTPGPVLAADNWPEQSRPSVANTWYISLPSNANTAVFFLPPHASRRGY